MITETKIKKIPSSQQMLAGLHPADSGIEFIGEAETKTVLWIQHGNSHRFQDLSMDNFLICRDALLSDDGAMKHFSDPDHYPEPPELERAVELYIFYMCGQADGKPDLVNGELNFSENYRTGKDCPSLKFDKKEITIDDIPLSRRELIIIDLWKQDIPDKAIAAQLVNRDGSTGITESTFNFHRHRLYKKAGVQTKTALLQKVYHEII